MTAQVESATMADDQSILTTRAKGPHLRTGLEVLRSDGIAPSRDQIEQEIVSLYERNAAALFRYTLAITRAWDIAQDAVQEAFFRYFVGRLQGETAHCTRTWLFRVAHNYVLDRLKDYYTKNGSGLEEAQYLADPRYNPEDQIVRIEVAGVALRVLTRRELECLRLRSEGMSYKEIAEVMSIDSGTVGAFLARGLKKIRHALDQNSG
jgi:RNA polymerase sigma-70 factor (ECF subfamily)